MCTEDLSYCLLKSLTSCSVPYQPPLGPPPTPCSWALEPHFSSACGSWSLPELHCRGCVHVSCPTSCCSCLDLLQRTRSDSLPCLFWLSLEPAIVTNNAQFRSSGQSLPFQCCGHSPFCLIFPVEASLLFLFMKLLNWFQGHATGVERCWLKFPWRGQEILCMGFQMPQVGI